MIQNLIAVFLCLMCFSVHAETLYSYVDRRGEKAPVSVDTDIKSLVNYLVESYNKEGEKARVILAWMVHHIDYDKYKYDKLVEKGWSRNARRRQDLTTGDIYETRVGVCEDVAKLYQRMTLLAGLDSVTISGYAGYGVTQANRSDFRHMWNAVKIDGQWYLMDPTWAIDGQDVSFGTDIGSTRRHASEINKREDGQERNLKKKRDNRIFRDQWFMTKPKDMIETHYPDDARWQLLPRPVSLSSFLK